MSDIDFGKILKAERKKQKMSVMQLAAKSGVHPQTIYKIEAGEERSEKSTLRVLEKLLNAFDAELKFKKGAAR